MPWGALAGIVTVVVLLCPAPAGATVGLAASHTPERLTGPATVVHRLDIVGDDVERRLRIEFDGQVRRLGPGVIRGPAAAASSISICTSAWRRPHNPAGHVTFRQSVDVVLPPGGRTFVETTSVARTAPWPWEGVDRRFRVTDIGGGGLPAATVDVTSPGPALGYPRGVQITLARPRRLQPGVFQLSGRADPLPAGHKVHLQRLGPDGNWRHVGVATVGPGHRFRLAARIERPGVHELIAVYHAQSPAFADDAVECGTRLRVG